MYKKGLLYHVAAMKVYNPTFTVHSILRMEQFPESWHSHCHQKKNQNWILGMDPILPVLPSVRFSHVPQGKIRVGPKGLFALPASPLLPSPI